MATQWAGLIGGVMTVLVVAAAPATGTPQTSRAVLGDGRQVVAMSDPGASGLQSRRSHREDGDRDEDDEDGGACACVAACTPGLLCVPPSNPCHIGTTSCPGGALTCSDQGSSLADGSVCGTNQFCSGGTCGACTAGVPCVPADPCHTGTTSCATGRPVCVQGPALADGTSCGTGQTCTQGICSSCTAGRTCTPAAACHTGITTCVGSLSSCVDTGLVPDGTPCGTGGICLQGLCSACNSGTPCTPPDACHTAAINCASGQPICVSTQVVDGTPCGTGGQVCHSGVCGP